MTAQPLEPLLIPPAHPHTIGVQNTADLVGGIFFARQCQERSRWHLQPPHHLLRGVGGVYRFWWPPGNAVTSQ